MKATEWKAEDKCELERASDRSCGGATEPDSSVPICGDATGPGASDPSCGDATGPGVGTDLSFLLTFS